MRQQLGLFLLLTLGLSIPTLGCTSSNSIELAPYTLGVLIPPSSDPASTGNSVAQNGVSTAVHLINSFGGIRGHQINVVTSDQNYAFTPAGTVAQAQALADKNAVAIVGGTNIDWLRDWAHDNKTLVYLANAGQTLDTPSDYALALPPSFWVYYRATALDMNSLGLSNVTVVTNTPGLGYNFGIAFSLINENSQVLEVDYPQLSDYTGWDPTPFVTQALSSTPDCVYISAAGTTDTALIFQNLQAQGFKGQIYLSPASVGLPPNVGPVAGSGLRWVASGHPPNSQTPQYQQFVAAYKAWSGQSYQDDPSGIAISQFDATMWTLLALAYAGPAADGGGPPLQAALAQVMDHNAPVVQSTDMATAYKYLNAGQPIHWMGVVTDYQLSAFYEQESEMFAAQCCDAQGNFQEVVSYLPSQYNASITSAQ